jgi:hypothetical protein
MDGWMDGTPDEKDKLQGHKPPVFLMVDLRVTENTAAVFLAKIDDKLMLQTHCLVVSRVKQM